MKVIVPIDILKYLYDIMIIEETEICGNFKLNKQNNSLYIDGMNYGSWEDMDDGRKRQRCTRNYDGWIGYHSHPASVLPYPSYEDIHRVLMTNGIYMDLLITSWGIWIIYRVNIQTQECMNYIRQVLNCPQHSYLYKAAVINNPSHRYNNQVKKAIKQFVKTLNDCNIGLQFIPLKQLFEYGMDLELDIHNDIYNYM